MQKPVLQQICFLEYGVKTEIIHREANNLPTCNDLEKWVNDAFYQFDTSRLRLDISIPQVALQKNAQGYVDPRLWDRGINAAFLHTMLLHIVL